MTLADEPPPTTDLSYEQYSGRTCCWCRTPLQHGAVSAGIARGRQGAHVLDVEVYACPDCGPTPTISRPSPRTNSREAEGARPSPPRGTVHTRRNT